MLCHWANFPGQVFYTNISLPTLNPIVLGTITMVTRKRAFVVVVRPETEAAALFTAIEDEDDDIESNLFNVE